METLVEGAVAFALSDKGIPHPSVEPLAGKAMERVVPRDLMVDPREPSHSTAPTVASGAAASTRPSDSGAHAAPCGGNPAESNFAAAARPEGGRSVSTQEGSSADRPAARLETAATASLLIHEHELVHVPVASA